MSKTENAKKSRGKRTPSAIRYNKLRKLKEAKK